MVEAIGFVTVWRETPNLRHQPNSRNRVALAALALALTASLVLASSAFGVSAGDEYLPQIPTSGTSAADSEYVPDSPLGVKSGSSRSSSSAGHERFPATGSEQQSGQADKPAKESKTSKRRSAAILASATNGGGGGGDGSGSILLSPLVLLMIGAVIAAALGMTLSRGRGDQSDGEDEHGRQGPQRETTGARTPEGEIVAGPDQVS
jgi:hypothetical protein